MSCGQRAVYDDEHRYLWLCEKYEETPRYELITVSGGAKLLDCYGDHMRELESREFASEQKEEN